MKRTYLVMGLFAAVLFACSSDEAGTDGAEDFSESSEVMGCDPLVDELAVLMDDFKSGLEGMLEAEKIDEARMEEWGKKGEELTQKIKAKGEEELGAKCWAEFNAISEKAQEEIAPLAMKLAMMAMSQGDIDMGDMMEKAEEAQDAIEEAQQ